MKTIRAPRALGLDCAWEIKPALAEWFASIGIRYAVRYIDRKYPGRGGPSWLDYLTRGELNILLDAGLSVGVVQRAKFRGKDYLSSEYGRDMGRAAALNATRLRLPSGVTVWCDAEWTDEPTATQIREYLNGWSSEVAREGYAPGLYVGAGCAPPMSPAQLYKLPRYKSYWQSVSQVSNVATRGYCLVQSWEYVLRGTRPETWRLETMTDSNKRKGPRFDLNMSHIDAKGGRWYVVGA